MSRSATRIPELKCHKRSGNFYVHLDGRQVWLGPDRSQASERHQLLVAQWLANGRRLPKGHTGRPDDRSCPMVEDLVARYLEHAETYYRRSDGSMTHEPVSVRHSVRPLLQAFRTLPADQFRLAHLKAVRELMIEGGLCRRVVNDRCSRIRRIFKWGASEGLVSPETFGGLQALEALKPHRSRAAERDPVEPVPWEDTVALDCSR